MVPRRRLVTLATLVSISLFLLHFLSRSNERRNKDSWATQQSTIDAKSAQLHQFVSNLRLGLNETFAAHRKVANIIPGSRGIVFTGSGRSVPLAIMAAELIRETGCTLPIEYAYMGSEVSTAQIRDLHRNNISSRNFLTPELSNLKWSSRSIRLGAAKVASILSSPFEKVLFLDPDVMPLQDPTFLFATQIFNNTGALFWPDVRPTSSDQKIWEITKQPFEFEFEFESGQIVLDKGKVDVFMGLSVAHYMCAEAEFYFRHLWGDKDTFRWGFRVAGVPYFLNKEQVASVGVIADERMRIGNVKLETNTNPTKPELLNAPLFSYLNTSIQGTIPNTRNTRYCGQNMLQFDFNDDPNIPATNSIARKPLFMHANGIKQFYKRGVHPFQVVQVYVLPNMTKSLTDYEKGMYDWMDRVYGQQHCGKLMEMEGLSTAFLNFSGAYPGVNERYSRARDKAIELWW